MFGRPQKHMILPYDKAGKVPVIRSSICARTGGRLQVQGPSQREI